MSGRLATEIGSDIPPRAAEVEPSAAPSQMPAGGSADFVDFDAYGAAVYTPPPALVALSRQDPFWRTFGGNAADPWGDGGEALRGRATMRALSA